MDIEFIGYVIGFWLFLLWKQYRVEWIKEYKNEDAFHKILKILEAFSSFVISVLIPLFLVYWYIIK